MARKKLRVTRKAHRRKPYRKRTGVRVKGSTVKKATYFTKDKGAPGRTPVARRWFVAEKGALKGWKAEMPATKRRTILNRMVRTDSYATTIRRLNALKNVSTSRKADASASADMAYLRNKYRK